MAWNDYVSKVMSPSSNWWDKKLSDKQRFQIQAPQDPSLLDIASAVPTPVGDIASGMLAAQDVSKGNYGMATLNALGLLPFIPSMGGVVKSAGKSAKTEFELAQDLAQKNAALPYSEGGLNLSPNNTAMQRARAMGFETQPSKEMYHYARQGWDSNQIDPSKSDLGFHTGTIEQANHRGNVFMPHESGGNIMPLMKSKYANMLKVNDEGTFHADSFSPQLEKKGLVSKGHTKKIMADPLGETSPHEWDLRYDQQMRDILSQNDYHGVKYNNAQEGEGISYAFTDPTIVRSRFAAFDPFRRNEADILAGVGVGIPVSSGLLNVEEKKEPKKAKKKSK